MQKHIVPPIQAVVILKLECIEKNALAKCQLERAVSNLVYKSNCIPPNFVFRGIF